MRSRKRTDIRIWYVIVYNLSHHRITSIEAALSWIRVIEVSGPFVNYPDLPRSGLLAPRLLRTGLPVSVSALASTVDTASTRVTLSCGPSEPTVLRTVPDSAGDFPLRVVRSVPLLPDRHSATSDDARFLSRLNTAGSVVSIVLPCSLAAVVSVPNRAANNPKTGVVGLHPTANQTCLMTLYPLPTVFLVRWRGLRYSLRKGA